MRKKPLPKREIEACHRLRRMREEFVGMTQEACASRLGITRTALVNYELARTPIPVEVGLRFCRHYIISEEWLATGKFVSMFKAAKMASSGDDIIKIFARQCMDLLSDPVCKTIPQGMRFTEAYDTFLAPRYAEIAQTFTHHPRIVFSEVDGPELMANYLNAMLDRWLLMLGNAAISKRKRQAEVQAVFVRAMTTIGDHLFRRFAGWEPDAETLRKLSWLRESLENPAIKLGPLHEENRPKESAVPDVAVVK